jgi:hypothetical protein
VVSSVLFSSLRSLLEHGLSTNDVAEIVFHNHPNTSPIHLRIPLHKALALLQIVAKKVNRMAVTTEARAQVPRVMLTLGPSAQAPVRVCFREIALRWNNTGMRDLFRHLFHYPLHPNQKYCTVLVHLEPPHQQYLHQARRLVRRPLPVAVGYLLEQELSNSHLAHRNPNNQPHPSHSKVALTDSHHSLCFDRLVSDHCYAVVMFIHQPCPCVFL